MEDYEEMLLQISEVMRAHNKLRGGISDEEAIEYIRNIVGYNKPFDKECTRECDNCVYYEKCIGHLGWGIKNVKGTEQVDKDKAMSKDAHTGFAVILEDEAKATRNNIDRMRKNDKGVEVFTLFKDGNDMFTYTNPDRHAKQQINEIFDSMSTKDKKLLYPDWKSGQKFFGKDEFTKGSVAYSVVQSKEGKPFAFLMAGIQNWNGMRYGDIGLGVSADHQGQGNANRMAKQLVDWYDEGNHDLDFLYWYARLDNPGSYKAALANGFQVEKQTDDMIFMRYPK